MLGYPELVLAIMCAISMALLGAAMRSSVTDDTRVKLILASTGVLVAGLAVHAYFM